MPRLVPWALVLPLAGACASPSRPPVPPAVATRADSLVRDLVERQLFQGAVVIAHGDSITYAVGRGSADRERAVPFTPDTPTDAASIAKTFTAAGLLLLASEGRVDLDAPVRTILPTFPHAETRVRHLLAHTAGLPDYAWFDPRVAPDVPRTNATHLALMARALPTPAFAPGTAFAYDNVAYDLAAMVIEQVTDTSYPEFIAARFTRPLGIEAFVRPARFSEWVGVRTRGYRVRAGAWTDHDAYDLEGFHGAANIYLSAAALQRWAAGYAGLMGPARLADALAPGRTDDGRATGISRGSWYVSTDRTRRYYTGHHNGFYSIAYADDARGISVAWVANDAPPAWLQTAFPRALVAIAEGGTPEPLEAPAVEEVADPSGSYRAPALGEVVVSLADGAMRVRNQGMDYDAFRVARGVHYVPGLDATLRFGTGADGGVTLSWSSLFTVATGIPREARR